MPLHEWSESILIAEVSDEPAFSEEMDALLRRLDEMPGDPPDVIIDAKNVEYMNSTNISQLLRLRKKLQPSKGRLRLCGISDTVWSILLATGLDGVFEFTDDVSTSLASLQIGDQEAT